VIPELKKGDHQLKFEKKGMETVNLDLQFSQRTDVLYVKIFSIEQLIELSMSAYRIDDVETGRQFADRAFYADSTSKDTQFLKIVSSMKNHDWATAKLVARRLRLSGCSDPFIFLAEADIAEYGDLDEVRALEKINQYLQYVDDPLVKKRQERLVRNQGLINEN